MKADIEQMAVSGSKKGVFSFEYVLIVVLIVLALLALRLYVNRAVCGKLRSSADAFGYGRQYEPGVTVETWH